MAGPRKPYYPTQENIPSQYVPGGKPYYPGQPQAQNAANIRAPAPQAPGSPPSVFVISTFDARPINAVDFNNQSGNDGRDTGWQPYATAPDPVPPYTLAQAFYTVGSGRIAVVRDWQALVVPERGEAVSGSEPPGTGFPIFNSLGASNTRFVVSFFVDGNPQEGMAPIVTWGTPFGDVFGKCYIIAQEGETIEMRLSGDVNGSRFSQALLAFNGNLLMAQGLQAEYEPATSAVLPVHNQGQI